MAKKKKPEKSKTKPKKQAAKPASAKKSALAKKAAKKPAPKAAKKAVGKKLQPAKGKASKAPSKTQAATAKKAVAPAPKGKVIPPKVAKKGAEKAAKAPVEEVVEEIEIAEEEAPEEVVLTDAEGRRYCRVRDCDQLAAVDGYCRYHYLLFWKKIQIRKKILSEGKLERYIEDLTARYPDKFLDMLRKDLRSEKEFLAAIQELEIDESAVENEFEDEAQTYIDEVRGMAEPAGREEEDF